MNTTTVIETEPEPAPRPPVVRRPNILAYEDPVVQARLVITSNGW
jgi:hypothetical protein